jgi:Uma2 family endonuclease
LIDWKQSMNESYEEILDGKSVHRPAPGQRHEMICRRLHDRVRSSVAALSTANQLACRAEVRLSPQTMVRPDLALIAIATGKLWLAAEIVSSDDHHADTVIKKQIYEEMKLPRLWMIDPRYDNVEVYHGSEYGLMLKGILAGRESLTEKLLPDFAVTIAELFGAAEA